MARRKKRKTNNRFVVISLILFLTVAFFVVYQRDTIYRVFRPAEQQARTYRYYQTYFNKYSVFGIDVSLYQGDINWTKLSSKQKIDFVFIRATAGNNRVDSKFAYNWEYAKKYNIKRGAYHYYRPNEKSTDQANLFINTVVIESGDLPPVLDIEEFSKVQSIRSLKRGLLNWLHLVENHYGVTPMLYTYNKFYFQLFAKDERFSRYPLWIAWYNINRNPDEIIDDWSFWQFTDKGILRGIEGGVDINIFNGTPEDFKKLLIP